MEIKNIRDLVNYFYEKTGVKYTSQSYMISITQAKSLLTRGFSLVEIKDVIDYCVKNPPSKGIYSFGYINTAIDEVHATLQLYANQKITEKLDKEQVVTRGNKNKIRQPKVKYDLSLFGEQE